MVGVRAADGDGSRWHSTPMQMNDSMDYLRKQGSIFCWSAPSIRYLLDGHHHHFFAHMNAIGISRYLPVLVYPRGRPHDAAYVANRNEKDAISVRASEGRAFWIGTIVPGASTSRESIQLAIDHIRRLGVGAAKIGVEMAFLPADAYLALCEAFGPASIVDAHRLLERLRAVKTAAELALLRRASDQVVEAMLDVIAHHGPGTTKRELQAALHQAMQEWGVSRLLSVDFGAAVEMVEVVAAE